ncbi:MAG TPA: hypothetical protein ENK66_06215 [Arcobacter sp.]|nr:hypothetical protein [Arcobacter sp.]
MSIDEIILIRSSSNDIYKIITKDSLYIFKIFHIDKTLKDLEFEIKYVLYLKANNILVSYPLKAINNKHFIYVDYKEGKKLAILTNYIEGSKLKYISHDVYLFGRNVAKFHKVSNSFLMPTAKQKKYNIFEILFEKKVIIENFLRKYHYQHLNFFSNFSNNLLSLNNIKFSKGYCHNDLHTDNTRKTNNGIYLFDFDFSGYGYVLYELSVFKWSCILNNKINIWKKFIEGYKSILSINSQEIEYMYSFIAIRDIIVMSLYINRINIIGHKTINSTYINERMEFLKNLNKQIKRKKI